MTVTASDIVVIVRAALLTDFQKKQMESTDGKRIRS